MMMKSLFSMLIAASILMMAGCQGSTASAAQAPTLTPPIVQPVEVFPQTPMPEYESDSNGGPMPNATPPPGAEKLIQLAMESLAQKLAISAEQIHLVSAEAVTWPDGSLGCPSPSSSYIQVLTPGYLIRLQALERTFEYHTDSKNLVIYCENPSVLPLNSLPDK